jgi:predicted transcriptional regulator of viral defense system
MQKSTAEKVLDLVRRKGVLRPRDLDEYDIPREYLARLQRRGLVFRAGRGLYVDVNADLTTHHTLAEVCKRVPNGVVCLLSALQFHGVTMQMPHQVWLAISRTMRDPNEPALPIRTVRMTGQSFTAGVERHNIEGVEVKIYSPAKTVVDCFKFRNKIGIDVALEALRDCHREGKCTYDELWRYAKICRQTRVMKPYLESIL